MSARRSVSRRRRLARRLVCAAAVGPVALACTAALVGAQETRAATKDHRVPRRWIFTIVGALTGAAASSAYLFTSDDASMGGTCTDRNCVVPISVGSGALIGYLVGREFDQLHALRYRGGAPLNPPTVSAAAPAAAAALAVRDTLVAVGGTGGVQVF